MFLYTGTKQYLVPSFGCNVLSLEVSHTCLKKCSTANLDCSLPTESERESVVRRTHRIKNPTRMGSNKKSLPHSISCVATFVSRF